MGRQTAEAKVGTELVAKFQAESGVLRQRFEATRAGGKHRYEKGLRNEQVLIDFLAEHLPPRYGVSRGEVMDSKGGIARQCDVVVYDALHAPMLQTSAPSRVFPAESVYAVLELKPILSAQELEKAVRVVRSVKELDRSAIVASHEGHRLYHGPRMNPPIFGGIFGLKSADIATAVVPAVARHHLRVPFTQRVDCVCVLGKGLVYHFMKVSHPRVGERWVPAVLRRGVELGHYECGEDVLLLFYLFLLWQLNAKDLFPPDLLRYASALAEHSPKVYMPWPSRV